jgi:hypothetical protein
MAAIIAAGTSITTSPISPNVQPFPATLSIPAGTTTSADFCPVHPDLTAEAVTTTGGDTRTDLPG